MSFTSAIARTSLSGSPSKATRSASNPPAIPQHGRVSEAAGGDGRQRCEQLAKVHSGCRHQSVLFTRIRADGPKIGSEEYRPPQSAHARS